METENYKVADCKQDFFQPASLNEDAILSVIRITISSKTRVTVVKLHWRQKICQARLKVEELSILTRSLNNFPTQIKHEFLTQKGKICF